MGKKKKLKDHYVYSKPKYGEENFVPEFIMLVGISGAGKTTYAHKLAREKLDCNGKPYVIISFDEVVKELAKENENLDVNNLSTVDVENISRIIHRRVKENLRIKNSIILDNTNLKLKNRKAYLNFIKKINCHKKVIIFAVDKQQCILNQKLRKNKTSEEKIKRQIMSFEIPFFEEGWDEIQIVDTTGSSIVDNGIPSISTTKNTRFYKEQIGFNQKTKHHKYTLDEHSNKVAEAVRKVCVPLKMIQPESYKNSENLTEESLYSYFKYSMTMLEEVAYLHDYGKLFVGVPKNDGSGDYKYFNHHNVSAYELMCGLRNLGLRDIKLIIDFLFYVNYHMIPFFISDEKTEKKWREIFGDWKFDILTIFNKCDIIGSGTRLERVGVN